MITINLERLLSLLRRGGIDPGSISVCVDDDLLQTSFQRPQRRHYDRMSAETTFGDKDDGDDDEDEEN